MSDIIEVGEGYRRLAETEIVQDGDECFMVGEWRKSGNEGMKQHHAMVYRRRVTPAQPAAEKPFWMVWNRDFGVQIYNCDTQQAAQAEAERLAKKQPGDKFYVLQSIGYAVLPVGNVEFHKTEVAQ